jgi:hypothetical protein
MEISKGDLIDRYSIVKLKSERTEVDCSDEFAALTEEISKTDGLIDFVQELYTVNGMIWDLESDIRRGKEGELGLEEVGRRAIAIRELNGKRVASKNKVNTIYNSGFTEIKINHASA